jgi:hypothetical protein
LDEGRDLGFGALLRGGEGRDLGFSALLGLGEGGHSGFEALLRFDEGLEGLFTACAQLSELFWHGQQRVSEHQASEFGTPFWP